MTKQCLFSLEPTDATVTTQGTEDSDSTDAGIITAVVIVLVLVSIIVGTTVALLVIMYLKTHKRRRESDNKVYQPQNVVLDLETREEERETGSYFMDNEYDVIDKPPQTEVDALYSNLAVIGYDYSLNDTYSQTDPVVQQHDTKPSSAQQNSMNVEMLYALPDKKKKMSNKAPVVLKNSSELIDYTEAGVLSDGMDYESTV